MPNAAPNRPLRILIMAAEMVPFVKTGQVADVIGSLAQALLRAGHDVRVAIPRYRHVDLVEFDLSPAAQPFAVPMDHRTYTTTVYRTQAPTGVPVYMVETPGYLAESHHGNYADDAELFVFYCRAMMEFLKRPDVDWRPDVIHCHDWQTAIVPNWLATLYRDDPFYADTAAVFTIHRLSHQGIFGYRVLEVAGIEQYGFIYHAAIGDLGELVDLLGRGIYYADAITTVSETYAREIQTPEFGERLDPLLRDHADRLFGIRNGIDTEIFDPAEDHFIAARYSAATLDDRAANKAALQRVGGLAAEPHAPLVGMVSRLTDAKGFDLITGVLDIAMANLPVQFYILGVGEPRYHDLLNDFARRYPGRIAVQLTFNEVAERRVYAGSDIFMMPSQVEPSGLGQMLAMRYGAVPLVRATGGLADTVHDLATPQGNGVVFERYDQMALYTALVRAVELCRHAEIWRPLQQRGMAADLGWPAPAERYVEIYRWAAAHRLNTETRPQS